MTYLEGSQEELDDLAEAYKTSKGSLPKLMTHIPHSHQSDEGRFIEAINKMIAAGDLEKLDKWTKTSTDQAAKDKRAKSAAKEAAEAEKMAKELGVHEEFFGTGKKGKRKSDASAPAGDDDDALKALIVKRQKQRSSGLDALAEKYAAIEADAKAKKGKKGKSKKVTDEDADVEGPPDVGCSRVLD
jgi:DnaJ family protein C protein 9